MTQTDHILRSAAGLGQPFGTGALVVRCWADASQAFGLDGHAELHPDANKVLSYLMGAKGLVRRGLVARVGPKLYELTPAGRAAVLRLTGEAPPPAKRAPRLAGEAESLLRRVLACAAWQKWRERRPDDITFPEAVALWAGDPDALAEAVYRVGERFPEGVTLADGMVVPVLDLAKVIDMSGWLRERFAKALRLLAGRNGGQRP